MMFTYQTIYCLTNNKVERFKVSSIKLCLDNRRCQGNKVIIELMIFMT